MTQPRTSVIIVSRHRTAPLLRCLVGLSQQDHTAFEVIVVADPAAADAVAALAKPIKLIRCDVANISVARNLGIDQAAGDIIAFIDDDAVAEPSWLGRLCAGFAAPEVVAATGFVRGRNGISFQWRASEVDALAQDHEIEVAGPEIRHGSAQRCVKTQGTNCAFRAGALRQIGGFDPAYRFFLDEADVNLRMAHLGATAIVPDAQVHHGFEASARRRADRVPLSLRDIGASTAYFLRRHNPLPDFEAAQKRLYHSEGARVARHRAAGRLKAAAEEALLISLTTGWTEGLARPLTSFAPLAASDSAFLLFPSFGPRPGQIIAGRIWQKSALLAAGRAAASEKVTTVICLSPTARPHRMSFQDGYWLQTGGLFGRIERSSARFRLVGFRSRLREIAAFWSPFRPMGKGSTAN
jgi:O-antigen biosynthesis protein